MNLLQQSPDNPLPGLTIEVSVADREWRLDLAGRLVRETVPAFTTTLDQVLRAGARRLAVDLGDVITLDRNGAAVLVRSRDLVRRLDGELDVIGARGSTAELLTRSGMDPRPIAGA